jgi:hypothetical protein
LAKVFFSYSHKDEALRNELETHLSRPAATATAVRRRFACSTTRIADQTMRAAYAFG